MDFKGIAVAVILVVVAVAVVLFVVTAVGPWFYTGQAAMSSLFERPESAQGVEAEWGPGSVATWWVWQPFHGFGETGVADFTWGGVVRAVAGVMISILGAWVVWRLLRATVQ